MYGFPASIDVRLSEKFIVSVPSLKVELARVFTVAFSSGVPVKLLRLKGRQRVFQLRSQ